MSSIELDNYIDNLFEKIQNLSSERKELVNKNTQLLQQLNKQKEVETTEDKYNNETQLLEQLRKNEVKLIKQFESKDIEIQNLKNYINELKNSSAQLSKQLEEKEKINIEQVLELYDKKVPELTKIAKEKGMKYTNKLETTKAIWNNKNNGLFKE